MRKNYIDVIRIICILLLFPFHTAMIYNNYNELWYLRGEPLAGASMILYLVYPWWMSLLFVMAGMSTSFALKHRTMGKYISERVHKLLIPFVAALFLIVPVQTFIADCVYNGYALGYFAHFKEFFKLTDWVGADGHFTPGHTWFILYLFIISIVSAPIIYTCHKKNIAIKGEKITLAKLMPLFLIIMVAESILNIGGKSLTEFMAYFLLGYFVFSKDETEKCLEKNWKLLVGVFLVFMVIRGSMALTMPMWNEAPGVYGKIADIIWTLVYFIYGWVGILTFLAVGKGFLNFSNKYTQYFAKATFPIYLIHQSVIVIVGYFVMPIVNMPYLQFVVIMCSSFIITIACYEIAKRFEVTRFLLGMKSKKVVK